MDQQNGQAKSSRNKALIGVLLVVFVFFLILMTFAFYTVNIFKDQSGNDFEERTDKAVAVIEVEGVIMDAKKTVENLLSAEKNKEVKAIIMRINSPGGAVGPTQEIYEEIRRIDKVKPVYASFGAIAASGGYYIGSATRKIYATPGTITGSIGVIMQFVDLSKLYEFAKVSQTTVKGGRFKDAGHPYRPLTEEEKALMGGMINGVHKQFMNDIMAVRKDRIKGEITDIAQGQVFSGEEAKNLGLVDELAGLWEASRRIHAELKLKGEGFYYLKKKKPFSFMDLLENVDETATKIGMNVQGLVDQTPLLLFKY